MDNGNCFIPRLYDVIVPEHAWVDISKLKCLFFVMEYVPFDLKDLIGSMMTEEDKSEEQLIKILY